jgi:hypothetical protein
MQYKKEEDKLNNYITVGFNKKQHFILEGLSKIIGIGIASIIRDAIDFKKLEEELEEKLKEKRQ